MPTFKTISAARAHLNRRGMVFSHKDPIQSREYYKFPAPRINVMSDHSATITKIGGEFYVSDFS